MYDSVYDESHIQDRREPGASQSASCRGLRIMSEPDNPVRAIESFVCALDLAKLGFRHADRGVGRSGAAAVRPGRSAEALPLRLHQPDQVVATAGAGSLPQSGTDLAVEEPEAGLSNDRQLPQGELGGPEGCEPQLCAAGFASLDLVGGSVVAIDGSFFHGDASKASIFTRKRLAEQIARLDLEIEAYGKSLEDNDAAEAKDKGRIERRHGDGGGDGGDIGAKMAELMARRSRAQVRP